MSTERPPPKGTGPSDDGASVVPPADLADGTPSTRLRRPSQVALERVSGDAGIRPSQLPQRPSTVGESRASLDAITVDAALVAGAENAVKNCLGVTRGENVVLLVDFDSDTIGAAMLGATRATGADVRVVRIGPGHARNEPFLGRLDQLLAEADVSMLVTTLDGLPVALRRRVIHVPSPKRRHGHLVGVTPAMLEQSLRADPRDVEHLGASILSRLEPRSELEITAPGGTSLKIKCDARHQWHHQSGRLTAPGWTNLPGGELLTTPLSVDGELVPDGGIWSPTGEEIPNGFRLRVKIEGGSVTGVEGEGAPALEAAMGEAVHGRRVGQVGLGTNVGVVASIGALLQDMKLPGFHLTLGSTYTELTHAGWDSPIEIPLLVRRASVAIDGVSIMQAGRYLPALFS